VFYDIRASAVLANMTVLEFGSGQQSAFIGMVTNITGVAPARVIITNISETSGMRRRLLESAPSLRIDFSVVHEDKDSASRSAAALAQNCQLSDTCFVRLQSTGLFPGVRGVSLLIVDPLPVAPPPAVNVRSAKQPNGTSVTAARSQNHATVVIMTSVLSASAAVIVAGQAAWWYFVLRVERQPKPPPRWQRKRLKL
jgi:hypothetical protein